MGLLVLCAPASQAADADKYPNRPIKVVVPLPPGTTADLVPRMLAEKLSARWGQAVIIDNRPGASHHIGAEAVARAAPDGYTLFATPSGPLVLSQHIFSKLPFNPAAFAPVSILVTQPVALVANSGAPYSNVRELIEYAKSSPEKLTFGSPGIGTSLHLIGEMLESSAGIRLLHVPYRGMAPATADLLSGQIGMTVDVLGNVLSHFRTGKLKPLAIASASRLKQLPDVQSVSETVPGFVCTEWYAIVSPPGTAPEITRKLYERLAEGLKEPDVIKRLAEYAMTPVGTSPEETARFLQRESARWKKGVSPLNLKLD